MIPKDLKRLKNHVDTVFKAASENMDSAFYHETRRSFESLAQLSVSLYSPIDTTRNPLVKTNNYMAIGVMALRECCFDATCREQALEEAPNIPFIQGIQGLSAE